MIVALPLHIVAFIVWLGGIFVMVTTVPSERWPRSFFVTGSVALGVVVATGIALVQLEFGGFSRMPFLHRVNMLIGLPAIVLYVYATIRRERARIILPIVLTLGVVASIISGVSRAM